MARIYKIGSDLRLASNVCILTNAGTPSNGSTGANNAGPGSICVDTTNKILYVNTNTKASPTWSGINPAQLTAITAGTRAASKAVVLSAASAIDQWDVAKTITDAAPATTRLLRSELTVTPETAVAVAANGSLAAVRGCLTLTTAKSITDGYLYGVQGKVVLDGATVAVGSDHVCGVLAQISGSSLTATSGHIAGLIVSGQSLPASDQVNMIYCESGGNAINAVIQCNVKASYFLDISNFETAGICSATGTPAATGATGWIKVYVAGAVRYIPLTDSVS